MWVGLLFGVANFFEIGALDGKNFLAVIENLPLRPWNIVRDEIEHRGLPRAIRAKKTIDTRFKGDTQMIQRRLISVLFRTAL